MSFTALDVVADAYARLHALKTQTDARIHLLEIDAVASHSKRRDAENEARRLGKELADAMAAREETTRRLAEAIDDSGDPPGWEGVTRDEAIRQAIGSHAEFEKWFTAAEGFKARLIEANARIERIRDLCAVAETVHVRDILAAIGDEVTP